MFGRKGEKDELINLNWPFTQPKTLRALLIKWVVNLCTQVAALETFKHMWLK